MLAIPSFEVSLSKTYATLKKTEFRKISVPDVYVKEGFKPLQFTEVFANFAFNPANVFQP